MVSRRIQISSSKYKCIQKPTYSVSWHQNIDLNPHDIWMFVSTIKQQEQDTANVNNVEYHSISLFILIHFFVMWLFMQIYAMPVFDMIETVLVKKFHLPPGLTLRLVARSAYVGKVILPQSYFSIETKLQTLFNLFSI